MRTSEFETHIGSDSAQVSCSVHLNAHVVAFVRHGIAHFDSLIVALIRSHASLDSDGHQFRGDLFCDPFLECLACGDVIKNRVGARSPRRRCPHGLGCLNGHLAALKVILTRELNMQIVPGVQ